MPNPTCNYLVTIPGERREIIAAASSRAALRTFCRRHGAAIGRRAQIRVELLDEALERGESELQHGP